MSDPYRVICADPPWQFGDKLPGPKRGAAKHYTTMRGTDICEFALPPIADDAYLFLWRVAAIQQEAFDVVTAWDFTVKSEIVWLKRTATGKRWFGMGRQVRMEHEVCLIATRGRPRRKVANIRSTFEAGVGRHSEKPEAFYRLVEQLADGPYLELFARRQRPGWSCYGAELEAEPVAAPAALGDTPDPADRV